MRKSHDIYVIRQSCPPSSGCRRCQLPSDSATGQLESLSVPRTYGRSSLHVWPPEQHAGARMPTSVMTSLLLHIFLVHFILFLYNFGMAKTVLAIPAPLPLGELGALEPNNF